MRPTWLIKAGVDVIGNKDLSQRCRVAPSRSYSLRAFATVPVQNFNGHDIVAVVPFGKGRVLLVGTHIDPKQ